MGRIGLMGSDPKGVKSLQRDMRAGRLAEKPIYFDKIRIPVRAGLVSVPVRYGDYGNGDLLGVAAEPDILRL